MISPRPVQTEEDARIWEAFEQHSRTFSLATRLLPQRVQMPVATLYLFCRTVDTIADERVHEVGREQARRELEALRRRLDRALAGDGGKDLLWRRLQAVHATFNLPEGPLYELIAGAAWDLEARTIEDEQDLLTYAGLVGGSVGAMMLPFLHDGNTNNRVLEGPARALGTAMQITNIIRDVGEDFKVHRRIYLPRTWLDAYGLEPPDLIRSEPTVAYCRMLERLMELSEHYYERGMGGIEALPVGVRLGIGSAARMYREIMNEVRAHCYNNLQHRAFVPFQRKVGLVFRETYEARKARLRIQAPPHSHPGVAILAD